MSTAPIESPGEIEGVVKASELGRRQHRDHRDAEWARATLEGRLGELAGTDACSTLSWALTLVRATQIEGEPVAWISTGGAVFFPPDAHRNGIDLEALPVVRTEGTQQAAQAADKLLRSGGFGLIVVDTRNDTRDDARNSIRNETASVPRPLQKRLVQHAEDHGAAVLFLTDKDTRAPSIGALVSFRAQTRRDRKGGNRFECGLRAVADNRFGPGWECQEVFRGPPGLR